MSGQDEAPDDLTGVWHGRYTYPFDLMPPTAFTATLIESGGSLGGTTHESTGSGGRNAVLDGVREGGSVRFVKVYAPASAEYQDVIYSGALSSDRTEIEGEWTVPGVWQGKFLMIRTRGTAKSATRAVTRPVNVG